MAKPINKMRLPLRAPDGLATGLRNNPFRETIVLLTVKQRGNSLSVILYKLSASYGYGLVKNRCFVDGNKRVALIAVYTFLSVNGIELTASEVNAVSFFLDLAASLEAQEENMEELAYWLKNNSELLSSEI